MRREMGSGLRLDQMRAFMKTGRWSWSVTCWPYRGRWVLTIAPRGDRSIPHNYLEAEKSGEPRAMTAATALRVAGELTVEGIFFKREAFESVSQGRRVVDVGEPLRLR